MYFGPVSVISITIERRTPTTRFQRVHIGCVQSSKFLSTVLEKYQHLYNILCSKRLLNRFHHFISTFINSFIAKTFLTSPICIFSIISDVCLSFFLTIHFCPRVICTKLNEANFFPNWCNRHYNFSHYLFTFATFSFLFKPYKYFHL